MSNGTSSHTQGQTQSYPWTTTHQGNTFVPGRESRQSRANRVNAMIQAVDLHFPNQYIVTAQQQSHEAQAGAQAQAQGGGTTHNRADTDLNGVGQQFHGSSHR
ncbi:hypothetical protein KVR01_007605 [Diaporthe batatas]|uniref:uncharacterized protein n=1 Tax=Diaporthe batatas TaxID=748121 RepID=UPI001D05A412|nr:uncharacterized protein KVR01_007605 [Diaporthe batatas]KAG8163127.1 hypothetical protein KVR01_007605 [Diaporthe batatas]